MEKTYDKSYENKTNEELFDEYRQTKDQSVKRELAMRYLYVVKAIAIQMRDVYLSFTQIEDIIQEGVIILMQLIDKYDKTKNAKFETYFSRRMRGLIIDIARKQEWGSRNVRTAMKDIENAAAELAAKTGRTPSSGEIADYLDMPYEKYQKIIGKNNLTSIASLDIALEENYEKRRSLHTPSAPYEQQPEEVYLKNELLKLLEEAIDRLNEKEKIVISLYYVEELNMREIAQVLEVSEPRISQIHSGAIKKLKKYTES